MPSGPIGRMALNLPPEPEGGTQTIEQLAEYYAGHASLPAQLYEAAFNKVRREAIAADIQRLAQAVLEKERSNG